MRFYKELVAEQGKLAPPREKPLLHGASAPAPGKTSHLTMEALTIFSGRLMREAQLHPGRIPSLLGVGMGKGKEEHPFLGLSLSLMGDAPDLGSLLPEGGGKAGSEAVLLVPGLRSGWVLCLGARQEGAGSGDQAGGESHPHSGQAATR